MSYTEFKDREALLAAQLNALQDQAVIKVANDAERLALPTTVGMCIQGNRLFKRDGTSWVELETNWLSKGGGSLSGRIQIDNSQGVTLHSPGNSVVSLGAQLHEGRYHLEVTDGWNADSGNYAPLRVGSPTSDSDAATQGYVKGATVASAANADTVDGQHFNWDDRGARPTYLWGANAYGDSFLMHPPSHLALAGHAHAPSGTGINVNLHGPFSVSAGTDPIFGPYGKLPNEYVLVSLFHASAYLNVVTPSMNANNYTIKIRNSTQSTNHTGIYVIALRVATG